MCTAENEQFSVISNVFEYNTLLTIKIKKLIQLVVDPLILLSYVAVVVMMHFLSDEPLRSKQ